MQFDLFYYYGSLFFLTDFFYYYYVIRKIIKSYLGSFGGYFLSAIKKSLFLFTCRPKHVECGFFFFFFHYKSKEINQEEAKVKLNFV